MSTFRQDVNKLREVAAQQGEMRQALRERDETIKCEQAQLPGGQSVGEIWQHTYTAVVPRQKQLRQG